MAEAGYAPDIIFVGATGGLRNMLAAGTVDGSCLSKFEAALLSRLDGCGAHAAKFAIITPPTAPDGAQSNTRSHARRAC